MAGLADLNLWNYGPLLLRCTGRLSRDHTECGEVRERVAIQPEALTEYGTRVGT
jgi:hypothetical protein